MAASTREKGAPQIADGYLDLVNGGAGKSLAKKLGLPQPVRLRRTDPASVDVPLTPGPVLVVGDGDDADTLARTLLGWDVDVRRASAGEPVPDAERWGAVVVVLTELATPADAAGPVLTTASVLRSLARCARVVTVSRRADATDEPALAAARQGVDGFLRSLAKELRAGATGNGIVVADGVPLAAPSVAGALRFLLSARSAFVDGQLVQVDSAAGAVPADWTRSLEGKVAVVTGAARGIGASIAHVLARDGARVLGVDVPAAGESLAAVMNEVRGTALQLDITSDGAGAAILERARRAYGGLDVVVHNAGVLRDKLLANMKPEQWDAVVAVNLTAQLAINADLMAAGLPGLSIVSLASTSGIAGNRGQTNYAFSKAGVIGATRSFAPLLATSGGRANAVAPGFIETDMTASIPFVPRQMARRASSLAQGGLPVDVAETVAFLASPQAGGITGQVLRVCGQNLVGQ
ncbi:short-chain dehydrogenase/reductase SDR [Beutenbergia cavernae DSM 12333]|uniref:Short-chain dehydrogenase/reductase SDR n=1 Tax=Beutenbergia cavernae (strain ATCC BAA-8 / DSM 12333 / CCUG 43141 / JCM 11478 / NBRC 16432 / NCIMB 13614 / HKI 0122) TaxID=471853 RepID=C5C2Y4_BEUC1|nr:3-oxoacyl-ACP reductase [Beutenbergia cavernae]ACQ81828.1 short-chain dehydrogenase/reductase SDR [Beutenbergia cavernae DSM 12333]